MPTPRTRGPEKREKYVGIRMMPSEYEQISARAEQHGLSLTQFLVRAALGDLTDQTVSERFEALEQRLERLENRSGQIY